MWQTSTEEKTIEATARRKVSVIIHYVGGRTSEMKRQKDRYLSPFHTFNILYLLQAFWKIYKTSSNKNAKPSK